MLATPPPPPIYVSFTFNAVFDLTYISDEDDDDDNNFTLGGYNPSSYN